MNAQLLDELSSRKRFKTMMRKLGFQEKLVSPVLEAALSLHDEQFPRTEILARAHHFFSQKAVFVPLGLEDLPLRWLSQLPDIVWATRKPEWATLPYFIRAVAIEDGILRIAFSNEQQVDRISLWDKLRIEINLALRPNLWQPLSMDDEREIWRKYPNLRMDLLRVD